MSVSSVLARADWPSLASLRKLTRLRVWNDRSSTLDFLRYVPLELMEHLELDCNATVPLSPFCLVGQCSALVSLTFRGDDQTLRICAGLPRLRHLKLLGGGQRITGHGFKALEGRSLETLHVCRNRLPRGP